MLVTRPALSGSSRRTLGPCAAACTAPAASLWSQGCGGSISRRRAAAERGLQTLSHTPRHCLNAPKSVPCTGCIHALLQHAPHALQVDRAEVAHPQQDTVEPAIQGQAIPGHLRRGVPHRRAAAGCARLGARRPPCQHPCMHCEAVPLPPTCLQWYQHAISAASCSAACSAPASLPHSGLGCGLQACAERAERARVSLHGPPFSCGAV